MQAENKRLRQRNGQLLIEMEEAKIKIKELEAQNTKDSIKEATESRILTRPQTAQTKRKEDNLLNDEDLANA